MSAALDIVSQLTQLTREDMRKVLASMDEGARRELLQLLEDRKHILSTRKLYSYKPYPKQVDFHTAGKHYRDRLFLAGNQLGKTLSGAYEMAMHLTGDYPEWWPGRRVPWAGRYLAGSESRELTRKGVQRLLIGPPEDESAWGTGSIPRDRIVEYTRATGVADCLASVTVRHACGDLATLQFASYDQGRTKWQADTLDGVWFDEEPPFDVYSEGKTRTNATGGFTMITVTPLLGMTEVVKRFLQDKPADSVVVNMTIEDALHYTPEERQAVIDGYPEHEREARAKGVPMRGSGRVFPIAEAGIRIEPFPIPSHWRRVVGMDFGWDHPAAMVWTAWDTDTDTIYVYDAWRERHCAVAQQAVVLLGSQSRWIPVAWPHDGYQHDKGSGKELAGQYRDLGVAMYKDHATFPPTDDGKPGGYGFEAGVSEMLTRFQTRRLRVFSHLEKWFEEFRNYHRKDGEVVKMDDDLMSATRIAMMMKRIAISEVEAKGPDVFGGMLVPAPVTLDEVMGY
jgi:phage terminase large subunit-like protein